MRAPDRDGGASSGGKAGCVGFGLEELYSGFALLDGGDDAERSTCFLQEQGLKILGDLSCLDCVDAWCPREADNDMEDGVCGFLVAG